MKFVISAILSFTLALSAFNVVAEEHPANKLATCTSETSESDIIAIDHDKDGVQIEFKRNKEDIKKLLVHLNEKIKDDPSITMSKYWKNEMLTSDYWLLTACGGTTNCSSKTCSSGKSCFYGNIGVSGCRCS